MAEATGTAPLIAGTSPGRTGWRWSAADTVVTLAVGLIVIIFAVFGYLCWQGFGTTISGAKARAQTAADLVAGDVHWIVVAALTDLKLIAALELNAADPANAARIESALSTLPAGTGFGFFDANGSAQPGASANLPAVLGDTDMFAALRSGQDWAIGRQIADPTTGAPIIVVGQRLGGDSFTGAAVIGLPGDLLRSFWEPQHLGTDSNVNVHRVDGWMVGRYPAIADPIDASKISVAWPQVLSSESGTYSSKSPLDGITRVVGYRHIPALGLVVFATVSEDAAIAALWSAIITVLWLIVPIALALLIGSLITARILRRSAKTQASLTAAVAHNDVLFREIHHRVKNNLQSVASLLQMQPIQREVKANMGQRIAAMSAVHEHIYRSSNFATVNVKTYLETLIANIRAGAGPDVKVDEQIEDIAVDKDAATPLGLIVNEVVANAFKHAFPDGRTGTITIRLVRDGDLNAMLSVEDDGIGFDPETPARGIGRRLIAALTSQLGGESTTTARPGGGSLFRLTFPLARPA